MSYKSKHVLIKEPQEGYNLIADQYWAYHQHLNDFDRWFILRLLPDKTDNLDVVDLGAGDGRTYKLLHKYTFKSYTACDISDKLLALHPGGKKVKKVVTDLEDEFPFPDESFDLAFSCFVLEHLTDLDHFFLELYRMLKPWWVALIWYFLQRREFVWKIKDDQFKIQLFNYRIQDIQKAAEQAFFKVKLHDILEKGYLLGWDIELRK